MPRKSTANTTKDELLAEFQALVADTEKLLQTSAELVGFLLGLLVGRR